ncbi:hypothetical protein Fmac_015887 [Flemingia macrophylla]|uniref:F-box domain-containing protein n=1 Tax=Flemingia macrophylla TaxID=520843 RepID=A0ABD1MFU5_9FABA
MKRKRQRWTHKKGKYRKDRISKMPDNVLLHIMSFLDTKSAVRTCVLSQRWKDLPKSLTKLRFNSLVAGRYECFKKFASWVLSTRDHSCSLFDLYINSHMHAYKSETVEEVIKYALFHKVQQLKLSIFVEKADFELFPLIFRCKSVEFLDLDIKKSASFMSILPKSLCMPELKSLRLSYVGFSSSGYQCAQPFSNCHNLNTLVLSYFGFLNDVQVLFISNSTLSSLTITELHAYPIVLCTPNLRSFTIKGHAGHQLSSTCNLSFIEEVNLNVDGCATTGDGKTSIIIKLLRVFANAKTLALSFHVIQMILQDLSNPNSVKPQPPRFVRLESLKVTRNSLANISYEGIIEVVEYLLLNSPMTKVNVIIHA